ncbi:hypothetical protein ACSAZK_05970 [Methanosarcina sp. Mfa9]
MGKLIRRNQKVVLFARIGQESKKQAVSCNCNAYAVGHGKF